MAVLIQIRDVEESVRDRLKARAAAEGVSFNTYLRRMLAQEADRPTRAEVLARARLRSERAEVSSAAVVREARDARTGHLPAS